MEDTRIVSVLNALVKPHATACRIQHLRRKCQGVKLKANFEMRKKEWRTSSARIERGSGASRRKTARAGTIAGSLNRAWTNIKAAVLTNDNLAVLEECGRPKTQHLPSYRARPLQEDLPTHVKELVQSNAMAPNQHDPRAQAAQ